MAYTLAQLAKVEIDSFKKAVMLNIIRDNPIMEFLPFENVDALQSKALRVRTLGTGGAWRKIGGSYTEYTDADVEEVWESVYAFGGEIQFDKTYSLIKNTIVDPIVFQTKMKIKALAFLWKDAFINGDHAINPDAIEGLKKRVAGMPSRQSIVIGDSDALDPTASTANARKFIDKWEEAWHKCNGGQVSAMFMNEGTYLGFPIVLRYVQVSGGNFLDVTKDSFDREITTYKGKPMIDVGYKLDQTTEIITDTETALDAGTDATSVYFASFDTDEGIIGIQLNQFNAYDVNGGQELESAPATKKRIDWLNGLANFGSHGIVRLSNLKASSSWT
jgi:hypothetical protein